MARSKIRFCDGNREKYSQLPIEEIEKIIKEAEEESKKLTEWPEI